MMADPATGDRAPEHTPPQQPVLISSQLMQGAREIAILHAGVVYRLRVTSNDKLILTK